MPVSQEGIEYDRVLFKPVEESVSGGCHADIFMPAATGRRAPVAITYHGGAFTFGDSQHVFTGHVPYLLDRGFAVVSLEYRLAPHVRFAEQRVDMLDGYRWCLERLPGLYPSRVDPERNFVFGGSAGGSATLFVAIDALATDLPMPKALYSVYPMADLDLTEGGHPHTAYDVALASLDRDERFKVDELFAQPVSTGYSISDDDRENPSGRMIWARLVTRKSALNAYMTNEPGPPFSATHSIVKNIRAGLPPAVLVLAQADEILDPSQTREVYRRLVESGVDAKLIEAEGMHHGAMEEARGRWPEGVTWWEHVAVPALEWAMERCV